MSDEHKAPSRVEFCPAPTLWTTVAPRNAPPSVLDRIDAMNDEQLAAEAALALEESRAQLDVLLKPYQTPVSEETLSQILD